MKNLLNWPVVNGALTCECGAPAVEEAVTDHTGGNGAYKVACTKCWRTQTTDPVRWGGPQGEVA